MEELKNFPISKLKPIASRFGGSLEFNPYCDLPPTIWYRIGIDLEPFDLGADAPYAEYFGTQVDTTLSAGGIVLPFRDWRQISGEFGPVEDVGEGSIYVSSVHNSVDVASIRFKRIQGTRFRINLDVAIAFEAEDTGFRDTTCSLEIEVEYEGLSFLAPTWANPESVKFPGDWKIPDEFDEITVCELFERFVDTESYHLSRDGKSFKLFPRDSNA
jgi:hypothetical protein